MHIQCNLLMMKQFRHTTHISYPLNLNPFVHPHVLRKCEIQPSEPHQLASVSQHCPQRRYVALRSGNESKSLLGTTSLVGVVIDEQRTEPQMKYSPNRGGLACVLRYDVRRLKGEASQMALVGEEGGCTLHE